MKSLAKFFIMGLFLAPIFVNAEVALTDDTNPDNLANCLKKINILPGQNLQGAAEDEQNKKIWACATKTYPANLAPTNFACKATKSKILTNDNMKQEIDNFCNKTYFTSIPCLSSTKNLKKKQSGNKDKLREQVEKCVNQNARYFNLEFCLEYLAEMDLSADKELRNICAIKERVQDNTTAEGNKQ